MEISPTAHIRPPFWWVRWVPVALLIAGLIALTIVIGGNVLVPLLVRFALAFMLEPLADWFQRRGRSRSVAVLLTLGSAVLMGALLLLFLLPGIYHQLMESIEKLPLALRAVAARAQHLLGFARERLSPEVFARLQAAVADFENDPSALTSRIGGWLSKGLLGLVSLGSWALVLPPIGSQFFITHGADVFLHNDYSVLGMFFHPACISCSWLAATPTGHHSPVPRQL